MKENLLEMDLNGKKYLIQELLDVDETQYLFKIGGYFSANKVSPQYDPYNKYSGVVIIPATRFNNSLPDHIKLFGVYHEIGHCQEGGLPESQAEYIVNTLKYEKIADYFAATILGKSKVIEALKEFKELEVENLKSIVPETVVIAFKNEMDNRIHFIEESIV